MSKGMRVLKAFRFLSPYIKKHRRNFSLFYLGWLVDSLLMVVSPIIVATMVDQIVYYRNIDVFLRVSLIFVAMSLFSCILYFLIYTLHHYLMSMFTFNLKVDLFSKLMSMDARYMSSSKTGDIITILQEDTYECVHFVIRNFLHMLNKSLRIAIYFVYILLVSPVAGIAVSICIPTIAILTLRFRGSMEDAAAKDRAVYGGFASWLYEIFKGISDIRLLSAQGWVKNEYTRRQKEVFKIKTRIGLLNVTSESAIGFMNLLLLLSIFFISAIEAARGTMTIGNIIVLLSFVTSLNNETTQFVIAFFVDMVSRLPRIERINNFLMEKGEGSWLGKDELTVREGRVEIKDLNFSYDGERNILDGFSCSIPAGERFALVGKSGCGKSTIASMLIGLYSPDSGSIEIDGKDIRQCSLESLRSHIGIVQQDVLLFDASIRDNLALCRPDADEASILEACRKAGIEKHFMSLPNKLDTMLGKEGINLSGGQKQRLAIARIYLKDPAIIVFDEATSALDKKTEDIIHEAWQGLLKGRTAIIIAHRQSSVELCDSVVLIEDGRASRVGDPRVLMEKDEKFMELFRISEVQACSRN